MSRKPFFSKVCVVAAAVSIALTAFAKDEVGRASGGGSQIEWQLKINGHEKIVLTVVDKYGEAIVKEFGPGRNPAFRLTDLGGLAEDGQYNYELRVEPRIPAGLKKQLEVARANEDDAAIRRIMKDAGLGEAIRQSGVITIHRNMIVSPEGTESTAKDKASASDRPGDVTADSVRPGDVAVQDQVIPDDLIVQSSTCTGFDCVDGESFGFDTLRLKENNLRINFDDTSSSSGFPSNDWRIIANEQSSGGANMFAIEDSTAARNPFLIEAAAPANSIYLDSTGRIGFRQSAPLLDLHVTTGNTPALRLEQTNSGGFTAQTWDIGSNEANFFVRDMTSGSRLPFRIRPGAPTSAIDISALGNIGVGTASPSTKMDIFTGANDSGLRVRGLTSAAQIGDIFVGNTGNLVLSTVAGTDSQGFIDLRPEDDIYGLILRSSNGTALFPWANFYVTDAADDYLTIDLNTGKSGDFTLTASGAVGIGTIAPSSRLHVNGGDIRVSGGSFIDDGTTLNVPDYVFEDSYDLMSIPELAQFIRENKHLPNVPNVAEVKAKGVNLSQMQMRLLEKVEELTLHTIAQHETIDALKQQLKQQQEEFQQRLEALEARTKN